MDDESWHGSDVKMNKPKRKRSSSARKTKQPRRKRRRGRPRGRSQKAGKQEPKAPTHAAGERRRGRERASKKVKTEARDHSTDENNIVGMGLDLGLTLDWEDIMDECAKQYVDYIEPDLSTVVPSKARDTSLPCTGRQYRCCAEETTKRRCASSAPGKWARRFRHMSSPDDTCVVPKLPRGPLADLLPPGTHVRRPSGKLVQLVAETIHESPLRTLRVQHVYKALQNKYPYFRFMSTKEISTWKSSIRHALNQKWFIKVYPSSEASDGSRSRGTFWHVNYANRPREWDMPEIPFREQMEDNILNDTLAALVALRQSPRIEPPQEPPAGLGTPLYSTAPAGSQLPDLQIGRDSPPRYLRNQQQEERKAYRVLLAPEQVTHPQQQHKQENQGKQLHLQHQEQRVHSPACPMPTVPPPTATPQSWSADSSMLFHPWRLPTTPTWCNVLDEIAAGNQLGRFCAQGAEAKPSTRLSTCSHPMSSHGDLPSFLGSPGKYPIQVEPHSQPLGDQTHKMEPFPAPPSPSIYIRAKQDWQPPLQPSWSGESSNLYSYQIPRYTDEQSRESDFHLWTEHLYAESRSDASAPCGEGEALAPLPFLCSPRLTQDMPEPSDGGGCRIPPQQQEPQLASAQQFLSRPEPSFSGQPRQEQEMMTSYQLFPSRPEPPRSRERTLPQQEPPPPRHELRSPHEHSPPRRPGSPALPEPPLSGRWVPGPRFWPGRSALQNLPQPLNSGEPVYSAIAAPVRMICMEDGTPYILGYPTFEEHCRWAENAKSLWEEYPRMGLNHDRPCQYTPGGRRAD